MMKIWQAATILAENGHSNMGLFCPRYEYRPNWFMKSPAIAYNDSF